MPVAQGFSPARADLTSLRQGYGGPEAVRAKAEGPRDEVRGTLYRKLALKCASVRSHASLAAAAS